jgi:hypothetical protein
MYVLHLLNLSERARTRAESHDAVRFLPPGQDIRLRLLRAPDETVGPTFERLADDLEKLFQPPPLPEFSDDDFERVFKAKPILAKVLDSKVDPLGALFDPEPIRRAIVDASVTRLPASIDARDAESWVLLLMAPGKPAAVRRARATRERAWAELMEREHWFWPNAEEKLRESAAQRGWPKDAKPARILAGIVHGTEALPMNDSGDVPPFDAIAIAAIRQRVVSLIATLREEADRRVQEARETAPALRALTMLQGWIDLYEQHTVARGLLRLCSGTTTIGAMLADARVERRAAAAKTEASGRLELEPDEHLRVSAGQPYPRKTRLLGPRKLCVTFDVECLCQGHSAYITVLRVVGLPIDDFAILRRGLLALRGRDLSLLGDDLTERLLNTDIASCRRLDGLLRAALEDHISDMAQTIVLSGLGKQIDASVPWRNELRGSLEVGSPVDKHTFKEKNLELPERDVALPKGLDDIVEDLRASYQANGNGHELAVDLEGIRVADEDPG